MTDRAWKLRRLMAMSPDEVAHRLAAAARDRLAPHAWADWSPEEAAARLLRGSGDENETRERWAAVAHVPPAAECTGTVSSALNLAVGRWSLFGHEVALDDPPRWNLDPLSGIEWPDRPSARLDYRRAPKGASAKAVWEAGRLTFLPTLALASRLTGDRGHADRARRWLSDFAARNPLGRGIHHTSGIEMAIRVITIGWTLALLGDDSPAARGLIAQQALWCRAHLSIGSSANNHLLAECASMVVAGAGLSGWREGAHLLREGLDGLERELPRQIHPDGVTAEQAFRYLPFVWELVLPALALAERAGRHAGEPTRQRLSQSLEFARSARRADGTMPPIGDDDDARILLAGQIESRLDLAGNALAAWLGGPGLTEGANALAILLFGRPAPPPARANDGARVFREGGHTLWRHRDSFATLDHGPLGLGPLAAHGHADALSLTLRHGGDDLIVDPGTLAYHEDERARVATRATPSHSTVSFGGRSQSEMLGSFLWGRRARVTEDRDGWWCEWWTGERHRRRVSFAPGELVVEDEAVGPAPEVAFALAPGAEVRLENRRAIVTSGRSVARFAAEGADGWRVEPAEAAVAYGRRERSQRIVARLPDERGRVVVGFGGR